MKITTPSNLYGHVLFHSKRCNVSMLPPPPPTIHTPHHTTHTCARARTHTSSHVHTSDWDCTHARAHTHTHARTHARTHAESRTRVDWDCQKSRNVFGCCEQDKIETVLPIHTTARSLAPRSRAYVAPSAYVLNIHHKNIVCSHSHKKKYIYIYIKILPFPFIGH